MASVWYCRTKNYSFYGLALSPFVCNRCATVDGDARTSDAPDDWLVSPGISASAPRATPAASPPIVPGTERPLCASSSSAHCSGSRSLLTWLPSLGSAAAGCEEKMRALYPNSCHRALLLYGIPLPYPPQRIQSQLWLAVLSSGTRPPQVLRQPRSDSYNASAGLFVTHPFKRPNTSQRRAYEQQEASLSWCVCHDVFSCG